MHNARLTERASFLGQVDVVPHASDRALRVWGQDVSETGMFLQTTQPFRIGTTVSLRFDVDGHEVHVRAAEIVWVRKFEPICVDGKVPGIGLRFISVDPPARAALRRLAAPQNDNRDTIVDQAAAPGPSLLPAPRLTLPPLTTSIIEMARGHSGPVPAAPRRITQEMQDLSLISLAPFSQPPLAISMPPDEPMLSSETRVFDGLPASPRAVTMGPQRQEITQPFTPAPRELEHDDADVDLFVGWTFRRLSGLPTEHSEEETHAPAAFHERFDDDAPLMMNKSVIEEPSIIESISLAPDDAFTLGSLPPGFDDGTISIRQLPLLDERAKAPTQIVPRRRSMGTALAFLFAGCCVGAVAGLVHHQTRASAVAAGAAPMIATMPPAATTTAPDPLPALAPLIVKSVELAEAELVIAPPPPAVAEPVKPTLVSTTKPKAPEPLIASPGRLEVDLPDAGKVKSVFALSSPSRVVVDLQDAKLPGKHIDIDEGGVMQLRFGHPKSGIERVVVVVAGGDKPLKPKARVDGDRLVVTWSW
ncbi:MAG: PilZ domain-containing protein [Deltaproteobacteria bacterium]|nr:PilZ domain-containing protein [Deltaproteobacteria bacterium]